MDKWHEYKSVHFHSRQAHIHTRQHYHYFPNKTESKCAVFILCVVGCVKSTDYMALCMSFQTWMLAYEKSKLLQHNVFALSCSEQLIEQHSTRRMRIEWQRMEQKKSLTRNKLKRKWMLFMIHERFSSGSSTELMLWRMHLEFDVYAANCMHDRFSIWYTWQFGCQRVCKFCNEQMMTLTMATTANQPATPLNLPSFHFISICNKSSRKIA